MFSRQFLLCFQDFFYATNIRICIHYFFIEKQNFLFTSCCDSSLAFIPQRVISLLSDLTEWCDILWSHLVISIMLIFQILSLFVTLSMPSNTNDVYIFPTFPLYTYNWNVLCYFDFCNLISAIFWYKCILYFLYNELCPECATSFEDFFMAFLWVTNFSTELFLPVKLISRQIFMFSPQTNCPVFCLRYT